MVVELISVGTELLLGNIVNTNAQYLSRQLSKLGLDCYYQTVVGDNPERIKAALDVAYSRGNMVILTGGLGPTKDDLTKEMLMEYFNKEVVPALKKMKMSDKDIDKIAQMFVEIYDIGYSNGSHNAECALNEY